MLTRLQATKDPRRHVVNGSAVYSGSGEIGLIPSSKAHLLMSIPFGAMVQRSG